MIYKVYYQENAKETPVRENTKSMYVEADSVRSVRRSLKDQPINIEFVQAVDENYLEYEKRSESFQVKELSAI